MEEQIKQIESGELTRDDVNALKGEMDFTDWNKLRVCVNDYECKVMDETLKKILVEVREIKRQLIEQEERINKFEVNHLTHIQGDIKKIFDKLDELENEH